MALLRAQLGPLQERNWDLLQSSSFPLEVSGDCKAGHWRGERVARSMGTSDRSARPHQGAERKCFERERKASAPEKEMRKYIADIAFDRHKTPSTTRKHGVLLTPLWLR